MNRSWSRLGLFAGLMCVASLAFAAPVAAHSDDGTITASGPERVVGPSVRVAVKITFNSDGHDAPSATATVVAERSGSPAVGPVALKRDASSGTYTATIELPAGQWTVRYTSLSPTAVLEQTIDVDQPTTTTSPATTASTSTTRPAPTTTANLTTTTAPAVAATGGEGTTNTGKGGRGTTVLFVGLLVVLAAGGGIIAARARRQSRVS